LHLAIRECPKNSFVEEISGFEPSGEYQAHMHYGSNGKFN
jgi:hypothetical protein